MNAYRVTGALATLVFAALFGWVVYLTFTGAGDPRVAPTGGPLGAAQGDDLPTGEQAYQALSARTALQRWRQTEADFPGRGTSEAVSGAPIESGAPRGTPDELAQRWSEADPQTREVLRERGFLAGVVAYPGAVNDVLEQPAGRLWRARHNLGVNLTGGWVIFGVGLALSAFLLLHGRVRTREAYEGRSVQRFNLFERSNHWMVAVSFILIALTGLLLLYGQFGLKPLMDVQTYADLAAASAWAHMVLAVPFVLGVATMFALWLRHNLITRRDLAWLRRGGFIGDPDKQPAAPKFNAGQKLIFWLVVLGTLLLLASGVTLMLPFFWTGYDGMQLVQLAHAVGGLLMIGVIIAHIYIGTIGMERAIDAMWSGQVDRAWAREHHRLWVDRLEGRDA